MAVASNPRPTHPMSCPGRRTYSYQGQDLFVLSVLGGMRDGFFLDSGASDGHTGNNSLLFESEYGWHGICIEPNDALFAELVRHRKCVCLNTCLYDRTGPVDFLESARVLGGIVDEYEPELLRFARSTLPNADGPVPLVTKQARTIASVLDEFGAPPVIDYWSLDTEGSELAILRSFPFDRYTVRVLTVEHNYGRQRTPIRNFLCNVGFRWVGSLGIDDCYVWERDRPQRSWRSAVWRRAVSG